MITFEKQRANYERLHGNVKCARCGGSAFDKCYSEQGLKEVLISGLCEECFDEICKALEEDV